MGKMIVIAQARVRSTRLPNKVLLKVCNKELLLHFIDRILPAKKVEHLIIATTTSSNDNSIVKLVEGYHPRVMVYRGSEEDVLDRYYKAATDYRKKTKKEIDIIRITSDCPLIDPDVIDLHITEFEKRTVDYLSSRIEKRTWPHGMEMEILSFNALEIAWQYADKPFERQHVTPYIYKSHPELFKLYEFQYEKDISHYRFTLDYPEDLKFIRAVYENLYPKNPMFSIKDILTLLVEHPELCLLNKCRVNNRII